MNTQTFEIEKITYGRKTTDKGIILGRRPWKWTPGNKYNPCFAKDASSKENLSRLSPHKQNFAVYIPAAHLERDRTIRIVNHEYGKARQETTLRIVDVTPQYVNAEILETKEVNRSDAPKRRKKTQAFVPQCAENVFGGETCAETYAPITLPVPRECAAIHCSGFLRDAEESEDTFILSETDMTRLHDAEENMTEEITVATQPTQPTQPKQGGFSMEQGKAQAFEFVLQTAQKQQHVLFHAPQKPQETSVSLPQETAQKPQTSETTVTGFSGAEIAVLTALQAQKMLHIDDLTERTGFPVQTIHHCLFMLEMSGKVKQFRGKRFAISA